MMRLVRALLGLFLITAGGALASGCDDACVALSEQICRCRPSEFEQQACIQRVQNDADAKTATQIQIERCEGFLDSCTCAALDDGQISSCGLTTPAQ